VNLPVVPSLRTRRPADPFAALVDPGHAALVEELRRAGATVAPELDELARQAASRMRSPMAAVALVADDVHVIGRFGSTAGPTGRALAHRGRPGADVAGESFCRRVVVDARALEIGDASRHPLGRRTRADGDMSPRAYLGMPMATVTGHVIGVVCVADRFARRWNADDHAKLARIAQLAVRRLDLARTDVGN
jgi:signal transduction protein with GAF and PtsI domain